MALDYVSKFFSEALITTVRGWNVGEITGYKVCRYAVVFCLLMMVTFVSISGKQHVLQP